MKRCLLVILLVFSPYAVQAKHLHKEKWYQDRWCAGRGETEVVLPDHTRCDCLTPMNAVEVDFGGKWYQAVGQSLYYALQTGHRAGVVLIVERPEDRKYWYKLNTLIEHFKLPIDSWMVEK